MTVKRERFVSLPAALVKELLDTLIVSSRRRLNVEEKEVVTSQIKILTEKLKASGERMAFSPRFVSGVLHILWNLVSDERVLRKLLDLLLGTNNK